MKSILLVEDTPDKARDIKNFLYSVYGDDMSLGECSSYKSAQQEILDKHDDYDLILLDMTMSTFDPSTEDNGGEPEPLGGKNLLDNIYLWEIDIKVIVVTMYNDFDGQKLMSLNAELQEDYSDIYCGYVFFAFNSTSWQQDLKDKIDSLI